MPCHAYPRRHSQTTLLTAVLPVLGPTAKKDEEPRANFARFSRTDFGPTPAPRTTAIRATRTSPVSLAVHANWIGPTPASDRQVSRAGVARAESLRCSPDPAQHRNSLEHGRPPQMAHWLRSHESPTANPRTRLPGEHHLPKSDMFDLDSPAGTPAGQAPPSER